MIMKKSQLDDRYFSPPHSPWLRKPDQLRQGECYRKRSRRGLTAALKAQEAVLLRFAGRCHDPSLDRRKS
jgi:hypothetical protein